MIIKGRLAQLVRAPARHAGGHRFESRVAHKKEGLLFVFKKKAIFFIIDNSYNRGILYIR
jgi:hypothetical protein